MKTEPEEGLLMNEKLIEVPTLDGVALGIARDFVALAVPALDGEKKQPVIGAYVLLPTPSVVCLPLADIARLFGLVIFEGMNGDHFAVAPGAVVRVTAEPGMIGTSVIELRVPGVVPKVPVRSGVAEVVRRLNAVDHEAPVPDRDRLVERGRRLVETL